jgi:hypothetical protein
MIESAHFKLAGFLAQKHMFLGPPVSSLRLVAAVKSSPKANSRRGSDYDKKQFYSAQRNWIALRRLSPLAEFVDPYSILSW